MTDIAGFNVVKKKHHVAADATSGTWVSSHRLFRGEK